LTKAYKELSKTRTVRAADLITLPGIKKAPKKRIAAILEPADEGVEQGDGGNTLDESEEENTSDIDESGKLYFLKKIKINSAYIKIDP
jgi:replication factor C subunit 1